MLFPASIARTCLVALLISGLGNASGSEQLPFPVNGGFGFDWLAPDSAQCGRITDAFSKKFKTCEFHASGAFGLPIAYHACAKDKESEFLVFRSEALCQEALETMLANAP